MKLSESLLGAILVGITLGTTVSCGTNDPAEVGVHPAANPVEAEPESPAVDPDQVLPMNGPFEDACPGCGMG